eukprot:scaffold23787_cov29-Tisochrysis_lutea.AAC.2
MRGGGGRERRGQGCGRVAARSSVRRWRMVHGARRAAVTARGLFKYKYTVNAVRIWPWCKNGKYVSRISYYLPSRVESQHAAFFLAKIFVVAGGPPEVYHRASRHLSSLLYDESGDEGRRHRGG